MDPKGGSFSPPVTHRAEEQKIWKPAVGIVEQFRNYCDYFGNTFGSTGWLIREFRSCLCCLFLSIHRLAFMTI
jgi:hypothetical protein